MTTVKPTTLVIFGVSGDLAMRKLLPAVYWLAASNKLPIDFHIVGVSRREVLLDDMMTKVHEHVGAAADPAILHRLKESVQLVQMDSAKEEDYAELLPLLDKIESGHSGVRLLHLSIPPAAAEPVITAMHAANLIGTNHPGTRLLLEKPFGFDLKSAQELADMLHRFIPEEQVYRIDHYLTKETTRAMTSFRFDNPEVAALWNATYIERVEIEASEQIGIEGRASFYEQTGALRDVVQSHLLSLAALTLMDEPDEPTVTALHHKRRQLLEHIKPFAPNELQARTRRGQYKGYRDEVGSVDSLTETFAALLLEIDQPIWEGVPVHLSGGKGLDAKRTEIRVLFKPLAQHRLDHLLAMCTRTSEASGLHITAKHSESASTSVQVSFTYTGNNADRQPDGYERVLLEAANGERTNFLTGPEVLATWRLVEPVLRQWSRSEDGLMFYREGTPAQDIINQATS